MPWFIQAVGTELEPLHLAGVDVWEYEWAKTGERVDVSDPQYGQRLSFEVWHIAVREKTVRFAAGEFSNGVWGFYVER
jgi:hypothetical protein